MITDKGFGPEGTRYKWLPGTERQRLRFWLLVEHIIALQSGTVYGHGLDVRELSTDELLALVHRGDDIAEPLRQEAILILRVAAVQETGII